METKTDILIIEDDQFMRDLIALSLRDAGYRVVECSGQRMQHLHDVVLPKVVIVDLIEPKRSSLETIGTLRLRFPAALILAISGYFGVGPVMADAAIRQLGVDQALAKPFSCNELVSSVKMLLDRLPDD
ncbi:response regulator [Paraburkholderia sp. RL17-337-BIB-A]|uniref:response regulator n=1 Tax=Paraburkholderia sp. RL17-337-BIB-A TaxID=3031636 RepID=UPI0038BC6B0D